MTIKDKPEVIILTEGGGSMGFGHMARCAALCEAFQEKGTEPLLVVNADDSAKKALHGKHYEISNWLHEEENLRKAISEAEVVIVDSYLASPDTYAHIARLARKAVYIDDNKRVDYPKGVVLNSTIYAEELAYPKRDEVTYLLGLKYIPLRRPFWKAPNKSIKKDIGTFAITLSDDGSSGMLRNILKALTGEYPTLTKKVILGRDIREGCVTADLKDTNTEFLHHLNAEEMRDIMSESDIAICAGGHVIYELARMGVPSVAFCAVESQLRNVTGWREAGYIEYAGFSTDGDVLENLLNSITCLKDSGVRRARSNMGMDLIDGKGGSRVVEAIYGGGPQ